MLTSAQLRLAARNRLMELCGAPWWRKSRIQVRPQPRENWHWMRSRSWPLQLASWVQTDTGAWMKTDDIRIWEQEQTLNLHMHICKTSMIHCAALFYIFEELACPADTQAETALRENSSSIREETLEPTRDSRITRDQNWRAVFKFPLREMPGGDDLCLLSLSWSLTGEKIREVIQNPARI